MPPRPRPNLPVDLVLDAEQQMAVEEMGRRETVNFNRLGDNQSRLAYIQALVDKKKTEMEKSEIEIQSIYFVAYLAVLICLTVLKVTIYKYDEEKLKLFLVVLNSVLFSVEIAAILIRLWRATITIFYVEVGILFSRIFLKWAEFKINT
ncbi:10488_t:CDS:2 [Funneliformis mosseae]|uniref:10488_t:CDS:1 n=1 Tax=Funneliformis mosseae TaxID=27381 RepID=A0A9N9AED5_FUNMO|nr:10488_t:CDS:2 [Funneliformis mosseae]